MVENGRIKEDMEDMGGRRMILSNLKIKKLYGNYNYDVKFNKDITLIYGLNGCGKTTILNIITAIITGKLYKLFNYDFHSIKLEYCNEINLDILYKICIKKDNDSIDSLKVIFNDYEQNIYKLQIPEDRKRRINGVDDIYFEEYSILNDIRKEFNYVYLALNRAISLSDSDEYYYAFRRRHYFEEDDIIEPDIIDPEIRYIENLISMKYTTASSLTNEISNQFRNLILKSSLNVNVQTDFEKIFLDFNGNRFNKNDILGIQDSYIKILDDLKILSKEEKEQYKVFFGNYIKRINSLKKNAKIPIDEMFGLFIEHNEMKKIQGIVNIAAETEQKKAYIMHPIELFLNTVNNFVSSSDLKKKIRININGRIYFSTENSNQKLSIQFLSSGERQLLVFFANLIFGVKDTSSGIFVVDEPELSLHLSWQKVFVEKALEVNNNVQFIFATHAPEIIGARRNKMFKLEKKYTKVV